MLIALLTVATTMAVPEHESLASPVVDEAALFTADERRELTRRLETLRREREVWLVVWTVASLQGAEIDEVAVRRFERWQVGAQGRDSGLLLVIAPVERRLRLEVGYGLEGVIPDVVARRLLDEELAPALREGRAASGVEALIAKLERRLSGEPALGEVEAAPEPSMAWWLALASLATGLGLFVHAFFLQRRRGAPRDLGAQSAESLPVVRWVVRALAGTSGSAVLGAVALALALVIPLEEHSAWGYEAAWALQCMLHWALLVGFGLGGGWAYVDRALARYWACRAHLQLAGRVDVASVAFAALTVVYLAAIAVVSDAVCRAALADTMIPRLVLAGVFGGVGGLFSAAITINVAQLIATLCNAAAHRRLPTDLDPATRMALAPEPLTGFGSSSGGSSSSSSSPSTSRSSASSSSTSQSFSGGGRSGGGGASSRW